MYDLKSFIFFFSGPRLSIQIFLYVFEFLISFDFLRMFDIEQTRGEHNNWILFSVKSKLLSRGARGGLLPLLLHFIHNRIYGVWILIFLRSWIWNQRFLHRFYSYFSDHSSAAHKSEPICISPSDTVDKSHLKKSHIYLASFCKQLKMTQFFQIRMVSKSIIMGNCRASGIRENGRFLTFWNEKKCKTWIY